MIHGTDIVIEDCTDTTIIITDHCSQAQLDNLKRCRVLLGPCAGSVFVRACTDCTLSIATRQLRTRDLVDCTVSGQRPYMAFMLPYRRATVPPCRATVQTSHPTAMPTHHHAVVLSHRHDRYHRKVHLYCATEPIIETTSNLRIAPFNVAYPCARDHFNKADLDPTAVSKRWTTTRWHHHLAAGSHDTVSHLFFHPSTLSTHPPSTPQPHRLHAPRFPRICGGRSMISTRTHHHHHSRIILNYRRASGARHGWSRGML